MFGSKDLLFSSEQYGVAKSLRFRGGQYFNRTPASAGNRRTFTISYWMKRGVLGTAQYLFSAGSGTTEATWFANSIDTATSADQIGSGTWTTSGGYTNAVLRDPSAWYHIVLAIDTTQTLPADRSKLYINGVLQSYTGTVGLSLNADLAWNNNVVHYIGARIDSGPRSYFDGYFAELYNIDGHALTPSSFGFYDNNGIWQPKGYTGTYGTNGFYLKFTDVGTTSGANSGYGKDFSGFNTNYWTTNNFGTTSTDITYDSMYDSPVNASNGITGIGNYAVLNPLQNGAGALSAANLNMTGPTSAFGSRVATIAISSGKWYFEAIPTSGSTTQGILFGVTQNAAQTSYIGSDTNSYSYYGLDGKKYNNSVGTTYGNAVPDNGVVGVAFDADAGSITFYKDNVSQGVAFSSLAAGTWYLGVSCYNTGTVSVNFGQRPFAYTPPSGFSALNTQNLTTPTITNGAAYMAAVTYTGSASTQNVTATSTNSGNNPNAVTFQPDLVWIKDKTNAQSHKLTDAVRGTTKAISTDSTAAEATDANGVTAFNNNGFSLGTGTRAYSDSNLDSYVAWQWKEGVSQGFDIVSYAGDNTSNRNISHNLGVAPAFAWVKSLSTGSFYIYHQNLTGSTYFLKCNSTDGTNAQTNTNTPWGTGNWSSTQFMVTNNATNNLNASSTNYIGYLWAAIAGYSAFGSFTANSSADGVFIYTGFRPRWIICKQTSGTGGNWFILDTSRNTYNVSNNVLDANLSDAERNANIWDILSNGMKMRISLTGDFIYAAFAENPFKISRAR